MVRSMGCGRVVRVLETTRLVELMGYRRSYFGYVDPFAIRKADISGVVYKDHVANGEPGRDRNEVRTRSTVP